MKPAGLKTPWHGRSHGFDPTKSEPRNPRPILRIVDAMEAH